MKAPYIEQHALWRFPVLNWWRGGREVGGPTDPSWLMKILSCNENAIDYTICSVTFLTLTWGGGGAGNAGPTLKATTLLHKPSSEVVIDYCYNYYQYLCNHVLLFCVGSASTIRALRKLSFDIQSAWVVRPYSVTKSSKKSSKPRSKNSNVLLTNTAWTRIDRVLRAS